MLSGSGTFNGKYGTMPPIYRGTGRIEERIDVCTRAYQPGLFV